MCCRIVSALSSAFTRCASGMEQLLYSFHRKEILTVLARGEAGRSDKYQGIPVWILQGDPYWKLQEYLRHRVLRDRGSDTWKALFSVQLRKFIDQSQSKQRKTKRMFCRTFLSSCFGQAVRVTDLIPSTVRIKSRYSLRCSIESPPCEKFKIKGYN